MGQLNQAQNANLKMANLRICDMYEANTPKISNFWIFWPIPLLIHEKQRSSQRKCREYLSNLPSHHDNATHVPDHC